jgi:Sulfatase-modifying factor enzyme 1
MRLSSDRTGYPLIECPALGLEVALLPVTKVQFERFLAEPAAYGDAWYERRLVENPRVSWRQFDPAVRERLWLTGVDPEEALAFARWLDEGFDLPTAEEWRALDQCLRETRLPGGLLSGCALHPAARAILTQLLGQLRPTTWRDLALTRAGVLEWVRWEDGFGGLGAPRAAWWPNLFDPQRDEPLQPSRPGSCRYFGFRPVRRRPGGWG